jgi:hypothetical protein
MGRIRVRRRLGLKRYGHIGLCALSVLVIACGDDGGADGADGGDDADADVAQPDATPVDLSEELFRPDHILEVTITLDANDWEQLRNEPDEIGMPKVTCSNQPTETPYTYFSADVDIDGEMFTNVGVRKKGGFGSLSTARPGLKVKAHEFVAGQRIFGLHRLTLNNNHQDDAYISQCLGYGLFRQAGLPASRCSFAHVTVNGEDLGIYSNVESIKKNFIGRHFDDNGGNIYESGGEWLPGYTGGFQPKTNKDMPDCSDLDPVVTAMQASDADFPGEIAEVIDLDAFLTYWGMEVLTDHWDGYANNRNNHFFYHDPTSDKMHWIPWGIDALFTGRQRTTRPDSVFACGSIPWRLYDVPETKAMYLAKLRDLIATVWDEDAIIDEIDRMEALITPIADPNGSEGLADRIDGFRNFVSTRAGVLLGELDAGDPVWPFEAGDESCRIVLGTVSATFDVPWDSLDDFSAGDGTMGGSVAGTSIVTSTVHASSGLTEEGTAVIQLAGELPDGRFAFILLIVHDPADMVPSSGPIDLVNIAAIMTFYDPQTDTSSGGGLILGGNLTLTSASTVPDAPIIGSMTGDVIEF